DGAQLSAEQANRMDERGKCQNPCKQPSPEEWPSHNGAPVKRFDHWNRDRTNRTKVLTTGEDTRQRLSMCRGDCSRLRHECKGFSARASLVFWGNVWGNKRGAVQEAPTTA